MKVIYNSSLNPFFNLALEEYMLTHYPNDDFFILWRNEKTVVVGKYQNAFAEINSDYVENHNINVVRRMTGGGAVFHDLGNLNFTFIKSKAERSEFDFLKYCQPIVSVLHNLGVEAKFEGRNDLTIDGMKFVGNAALIWNEQVMYHGCILFSADLSNLAQALNVNPMKFTDKAVKSVRKRVTNIIEHLDNKIDVLEFKDLLIDHVVNNHNDSSLYQLTETDKLGIEKLANEKYSQWEWIFGKSPQHEMRRMFKTASGGVVEVYLNVKEGIVNDVNIYGDFFSQHGVSALERALNGTKFTYTDMFNKIEALEIEQYISNVSSKEFVDLLIFD